MKCGVRYSKTTMVKTNAEAATRTAAWRPSGTETARSDATESGDTRIARSTEPWNRIFTSSQSASVDHVY